MISKNKNIRYEKGTFKNLINATKIQMEIFENARCAFLSFLECLVNYEYKESFYIIYYKDKMAGIISFYDGIYYGKENEIWIAWFGILPKFRRQNIATQTIKDFCEFWRKKGYNNLRLYSYRKKFYKPAINFYRKNMDIEENYNYNYKNEKILIFTKNLNKSHYEKWNNKDIFYYSDKLEEKSSLVLWKSIYGENYGKKN